MTPRTQPSNYFAHEIEVDSMRVIRLADAANRTEISILPELGNMAYDMRVKGHPLLWSPVESLEQWRSRPAQLGIPFLGPWANRLDQDAYFANGKRYSLNSDVAAYPRDPNGLPIHGILLFAKHWKVVRLSADSRRAEVASRLEFWRHPEWMAQFPFAHTIEMAHRLSMGELEVRLSIENHSTETMPLSVGFHPWYQITDCPRDEWRVHLPVRMRYPLSDKFIPTGETQPYSTPDMVTLANTEVDDVFGGINPGEEFTVQGKSQKVSVRFGPKYPVAVVYAPLGCPFICFEP